MPLALTPLRPWLYFAARRRGRHSFSPSHDGEVVMWRTWKGLVVTTAALIGLMGCHKAEYLQPPKPKDEFKQPPEDDPRFTNPINYPAKLLNQDSQPKDANTSDAPGHGLGSHGGGGGGGMH
jgi:hypothetical protein